MPAPLEWNYTGFTRIKHESHAHTPDRPDAGANGMATARAADTQLQPNILWLVAEDANVKWFGCYGSAQATTPNIDKLAAEGFRYVNALRTHRFVRHPGAVGLPASTPYQPELTRCGADMIFRMT